MGSRILYIKCVYIVGLGIIFTNKDFEEMVTVSHQGPTS